MKHQLTLTTNPINEAALIGQRVLTGSSGAAVCFTGVVRGMEGEHPISALEYETYARMAEHQFELIFQEMEKRWPIESVRVVHRIGVVKVNEASVWVEVLAPHRAESFAACQHIIEEMKRLVPIWKKARASL